MRNFPLLVLLIILIPAGDLYAAGPSMHDFAYGVELSTPPGSPFYMLSVPPYVYESAVDPNLGDMAVFNADGEPVTYALRVPKDPERVERTEAIPFYPIPPQWSGGTDAGVELEVVRDKTGSVVRVVSRTEPGAQLPHTPQAYLLDASGLDGTVRRFELAWPQTPDGFMARALIECSDDLKSWRPTGTRDTIADLTYGEHRLTEAKVGTDGREAKFYRLSFPGQDPPPMFTDVIAVMSGTGLEPRRDTGSAYPQARGEGGDTEYVFDTNGHRPVDRISVVLPQDNSLAEAEFLSRDSADAPWRMRAKGQVYRFRSGEGFIDSPELAVPVTTDRYWMMRVVNQGGIGSVQPRLVYSWLPHELTFIARGGEPYTLAYASARLTPEKLAATGLMKDLSIGSGSGLDAEVKPAEALPARRLELGGRLALEPLEAGRDWRVYILWGVLLSGVLLLGWIAAGLFRKMEANEPAG